MQSKKNTLMKYAAHLSLKLRVPAVVLAAIVGVTGCGTTYTGIYQLPTPPTRDPASFTQPAPLTGPPLAPMNECKQGDGTSQVGDTSQPGGAYGGPGYYRAGYSGYRLGTGDRIRVIVLQDTEFSGDYDVDQSGSVAVRMLGPIRVAGMTLAEIETMLRDRYRESGYLVAPRLSVELVTARPYYIVGEASRNGQFPYVACLRVLQAVAIAGGYTRRASKTRMTIRRFYSQSAEEEYVSEDTLIEPGDVLRIPERYF